MRHRTPPDDVAIGRLLAAARRDARMTQAEVARVVGTSQSRVARLETGARHLTFAQAIELADLYGVEIGAFVPEGPVA